MCGIAGFIGDSKNPNLTFEIISNLFKNLEVRGKDSSGFWGGNRNGDVLYHKEPTRSSHFIQKDIWKNIKNINPNILLCHAREASTGSGLPRENINNHPFVNEDLSIALIHNGRVPDRVYQILKNKYQVYTSCDSEILLRIFQAPSASLDGIRDIWSLAYDSQMAVAIGEMVGKKRKLWLFRNEFRTVCCVDLTQELGQVFFASTPEIWSSSVKNIDMDYEIKNMPPEEVWFFELENSIEIKKYEVKSEGLSIYNFDEFINCQKPKISTSIYTNLDFEENCKDSLVENYNKSKDLLFDIINNSYEIESVIDTQQNLNFELLLNKLSILEKEISNILEIIKK